MKTLLMLALLAQVAPFAGQGGQMPDPKQISGVPLPIADLPAGTVTVRVIRGALSNTLPGQTVELTVNGAAKSAKTDDAGRATFDNLTVGATIKATVTVDGEKIDSQEFQVPPNGGVRLMLVATDPDLEKKAAADKKLAEGPAVTGMVVIGDQSRFVIEIGDDALNVFNIMQIVNTAKRPVKTATPIVFDLPKAAVGAGMMDGSTKNAVAAGNRVTVTGPFAPGNTLVQFAYSIPLGGDTITIDQKLPVELTQVSIVTQQTPGMQMASPQLTEHREMAADGENYIVGQGGAVRAGDTVSITLSGLPHRAAWPKWVALGFAGVILSLGAWSATRGKASAGVTEGRAKIQARREKLFADLATLETARRTGTVDAASYATRREALVTALEDLYAGIDREAVA
jgi:hypothetical protein